MVFKSLLSALTVIALPVIAKPVFLGPENPGAESGVDYWYYGSEGAASTSIDSSDPADGTNDFTLENSAVSLTNATNWRSFIFPLGSAARGACPMTFSFAYKFPNPVKQGDNMHIQFRFYNDATNFISQKDIWLGYKSHDSAMTNYRTNVMTGIRAPRHAEFSDVTLTANFYPGDSWSSGIGRFDDISVMAVPPFPLGRAITWTVIALLGMACLAVLFLILARKRK